MWGLLQHQFGMQRTGGFDRFENVDHFARGDAQRIETRHEVGEFNGFLDNPDLTGFTVPDLHLRAR